MQWNYHKIEYFLKVAETLNFTKAAAELYMSAQALNKQIIMMEQELGEPLFERSTRSVKLTETGLRMQKCFAPAVSEFHRAQGEMDAYLLKKKNTIRIAFYQAIPKNEVIAPIIQHLRGVDKSLHVEPFGGEIDDMIDLLYGRGCDIVLTNVHDFESWPGTEMVPFLTTPAQIAVSLYHPWAAREKITKQDLQQGNFLLLERKKELEENSFYRNLKPKTRLYSPNFSSMVATLAMGDCFAVIPKLFESMNSAGLRYLDLPEECRFNYRLVAIFRSDHPRRELFETLKTFAEDEPIKMK